MNKTRIVHLSKLFHAFDESRFPFETDLIPELHGLLFDLVERSLHCACQLMEEVVETITIRLILDAVDEIELILRARTNIAYDSTSARNTTLQRVGKTFNAEITRDLANQIETIFGFMFVLKERNCATR